ncbi:unnamed protein product [Symbiodinium sp. CCMP2592]|nr:unnamed protein product [Symbiodinium sp. CCMP2592]
MARSQVCGYPLYVDSKTHEPFVLELYRAKGGSAKDLITSRLRHDALTILRQLMREKEKPGKMHYPSPLPPLATEAKDAPPTEPPAQAAQLLADGPSTGSGSTKEAVALLAFAPPRWRQRARRSAADFL